MKNSIKTIAIAVIFSAALVFNASASDKEAKKTTSFQTGIFASKSGKIQVAIDKYTNAKTTIVLIDFKGDVVYREVVERGVNKFRKALDVQGLPSGTYNLQISSNGETQTKKFEISQKTIERAIAFN